MSSVGYVSIEAMKRRNERLRCKAVRVRIESAINKVNEAIKSLALEGSAPWVMNEIKQVQQAISLGPKEISDEKVDESELVVNEALSKVRSLNSLAKERLAEIREDEVMQKAELKALRKHLNEVKSNIQTDELKEVLNSLIGRVDDASDNRSQEATSDYESFVQRIKSECDDIVQKQDALIASDEGRMEVLRALHQAMREQGFSGMSPTRSKDKMIISGSIQSQGKKATFIIHEDCNIEFDLDGYQGRECGEHLDDLLEVLKKKGVISGPPQHDWKASTPDRILKGSKDLPIGGEEEHRSGGA